MLETIIIDCDGVLTDGKLYMDHTGRKMFKAFHSRDIRAIRELVARGYEVVIITADDWEGGQAYADKVGAVFHCSREKHNYPCQNYAAIGDDVWDLQLLEGAKYAFCPADADKALKKGVQDIRVLQTRAGDGVIAEMLREIIKLVDK